MRLTILCAVVIFVAGCNRPEEPSTVRGKLFMLVSESHLSLIKEESAEFMAIYDKTNIQLAGTSTREAIVALLNDSVHCICVDRQLNSEELEVVHHAGIKLATIRIGRDALALVVSEKNALKEISLATLKSIFDRSITTWKEVPGSYLSGKLELILSGKNSGVHELLQRRFFNLQKEIVPTKMGETEKQIVEYVASHPEALGIVSFSAIVGHSKGIQTVAVESSDSTLQGHYIGLNQSNIYQELYPLNYSLYLYVSEETLGVGSGFSTFVMTLQGQKIIQDYGLAPEIVPSRIIQLKSE